MVAELSEARDTRERLVDAGRAHLDEEGLEGLSLRAIARRAGVSHGAPMRHFRGVAGLLAAVAAQGFRELWEAVAAEVARAGPGATPLERLAGASRGYVHFALRSPGVFGLMFRPERFDISDAEFREAGTAAFEQLVALVAVAQDAGCLPHVDAPPRDVAACFWAAVHGLAELWIQGSLQGAVGGTADLDRLLSLTDALLLGPARPAAHASTTASNIPPHHSPRERKERSPS